MVPDMSEEFGPDFITVTDEDGNEFELEHVDTLDYNGQTYMAFFPAIQGEEQGDTVEEVDQQFMEALFADEDEEHS